MSLTIIAAFVAAFVAGTFFDYVIHRWLAHGPLAARESGSLTRHAWVHHKVFTERRGMTAPRGTARREHVHISFGSLLIILPVLLAAAAAAGLFVAGNIEGAPLMGGAMAAGLFSTVICYDVLHWMHHAELPRFIANFPLYKQLRAWHYAHHEEPESRFASLLPLWDFLLFTHTAPKVVAEAAPETRRPETRQKPRRATREQAQTRLDGMMQRAMSAAEDNLDSEAQAPKKRSLFGGSAEETPAKERTPARKRGVTDNQRALEVAAKAEEATKTAEPARKPRSRRRTGTKTTADWLASIDVGADLDIQVTAVKEDEE